MKKALILLLSFGLSVAVFAQRYDHNNGGFKQSESSTVYNDGRFRDGHRVDSYGFDARGDHDQQMARINHEYDDRIASVQYDRSMRSREKAREIRCLNEERNERLRGYDMTFSKGHNRYDHDVHEHQRNW